MAGYLSTWGKAPTSLASAMQSAAQRYVSPPIPRAVANTVAKKVTPRPITRSYVAPVAATNTSRPAPMPTLFNPATLAAQGVLPPGGIKTPTLFSKVVPRNMVVNQDLVNNLAFSRVNPEIDRLRTIGYSNLMNQLAGQGGLRFGQAGVDQQSLMDQYERQRKEMAQPFIQEGVKRLSDYYDTLQNEYYKDPNAFQFTPLNVNKFLGY